MRNFCRIFVPGTLIGMATLIASPAFGQFGVHISDPVASNGNAKIDTGFDYGNQIASVGPGQWLSMCRTNDPGNHGQFGDDYDILGCRSIDGAFTWSMPFPINTDATSDTGRDRGPQYATDGQGNWMVVWYRGDYEINHFGDQDVFYATSTDNTQTWSAPVDLLGDSDHDGAEDDHPQVATDGHGRWIITWGSKRTLGGTIGSDDDVLEVHSDDFGAHWTAPQAVNSNAANDVGDDRIVQIANNGTTWIIAWQSDDSLDGLIGRDKDILYARSMDNGNNWEQVKPLNSNAASDTGDDTYVSVISDEHGHWVAVWSSTDTLNGTIGRDADILYATSDDDGATWTDPAPLNGDAADDHGDDITPQVRTDGHGNWVAVWSSDDSLNNTIGTDPDILISRSTDNGLTWTYPAPACSLAAADGHATDKYPHLANDGNGNWLVQWRSTLDRGGYGTDWDDLVARFFLPTRETPIVYVNQNAAPGGDGASWSTAFTDLQQALDLAANYPFVHEIWVAKGQYKPDWASRRRGNSFVLINGVGVYGGFAGTESSRVNRDPVQNPTYLSGDIGTSGYDKDNSYHVVITSNTDSSAVLDGFTIKRGWADGGPGNDSGSGLYNDSGSPSINNCSFIGNYAYGFDENHVATGDGAGLSSYNGSPLITNCYFARNVSRRRGGAVFCNGGSAVFENCQFYANRNIGGILGTAGGGAVFNYFGTPTYENCDFDSNSGGDGGTFYNLQADTTMMYCHFTNCDGRYGAGVYNYGCSPLMAYCTFRDNDRQGRFLTRDAGAIFNRQARPTIINCLMADCYAWRGGAMYNIESSPLLINCTIVNNLAQDNSTCMHNLNSTPVIRNCIIWNPVEGLPEIADLDNSYTTAFYSDIRGGWTGDNVLNVDPMVMNVNGDYPLMPNSPLIDAGSNFFVPQNLLTDLLGNPRRIDDPNVPDNGQGTAPIVDMGAYEFVP